MKSIPYKKIFWWYTALVVIQTFLPINDVNNRLNHTYVLLVRGDYLVHILIFGLWIFLLHKAYGHLMELNNPATWLLILMVFAFTVLSEIVQLVVPYRSFNINDLVSNLLGVSLGLIFLTLNAIYRKIKKQRD